jgi:hypothetical protein
MTPEEFTKTRITGQTFREISEKFGKAFNDLGQGDPIMANYAIAFAWFREMEHLPVPEAYSNAMALTTAAVEGLFEDRSDATVQAVSDFVSRPLETMP